MAPATTGDEIQFSANHADYEFSDGKNRELFMGERNGNSYPVYWVNNDEISIYCPQAASSPNTPNREFDYKVVVDNDKSSTGTLAKVNMGEKRFAVGLRKMHIISMLCIRQRLLQGE